MTKSCNILFLLLIVIVGCVPSVAKLVNNPGSQDVITKQTVGYKNIMYLIEKTPITLINGNAEMDSAPGSASKIITRYFGMDTFGDLNGDGKDDVAFLLTQQAGGSGTFFYVAVALQNAGEFQGTDTVFLGDRIEPQKLVVNHEILSVTYLDRKTEEPFSAKPSVEKIMNFRMEGGNLVEIND